MHLEKRSYDIIIGNKILKDLARYLAKLKIGRDAYIITNLLIKNKYGKLLEKALKKKGFSLRFKIVADTEKSKSIETASSVVKDLTLYDKKRNIFIIAFGGGVVGDLAGFVASIYKRGTPYIQIPTTLLAQVDSSIGGKTAVDLEVGKNLVGAFYQPKLVFSDIQLLKTLDLRQIRSGLAEVIKYGIIKDRKLFNYLEKNYRDILNLRPKALEFIVWRSSIIKAAIVEQDEREEKGLRTILNFGHTLGHALEAASGFKGYNHGEAIALGMLLAAKISRCYGLINTALAVSIEDLIKKIGLPVRIKGASLKSIIEAHYRDKKFVGQRNRFVLIRGIGRTTIVENIPLSIIKTALKQRL